MDSITPAFPAAEVEKCIRGFLAQEGSVQSSLRGAGKVTNGLEGIVGPQPVIDSLVVVELLVVIEPKVPFDLPDSLVQAGGYEGVDEVVQDLIPRIQGRWRKHYGGRSHEGQR